jgi:hypothetical protein
MTAAANDRRKELVEMWTVCGCCANINTARSATAHEGLLIADAARLLLKDDGGGMVGPALSPAVVHHTQRPRH